MSLPTLPSRTILAPGQTEVWGYTLAQMQAYGQVCRDAALLDAMNATLPFGKTGAVIAAAIGALK